MFQGRKTDFLPSQVAAVSIPTQTKASLKRKRDEDEDADLYGNEQTSDKKVRSESVVTNGKTAQFASQPEGAKEEEKEWFVLLVNQDGSLQV